jgi:hypothetical protein
MQHYQIDGKLLRALATTLSLETTDRGSCLIDKPDGKNARDWTIRSQAPKLVMIRAWGRFNDLTIVGLRELIILNEGLR